jgi:DegV family protein with EDD domain
MNIALVTDSTCDLPSDLVSAHQIHVVPNILVMDGLSVEDNKEFSRVDFYRQLPDMATFPTTSTASVGTYQALYEQLVEQGFDQILSVHASQELSGIFNAASTAAQSLAGQVTVIDSQQVSLGLGFQILEAAEAISQGAAIDSIVDLLSRVRERTRLVAMLDTLEFIRRSGRVSWARARLGALLNLKPFVEVKDGHVQSLGELRTRKKGVARLLEMMQSPQPLKRFALLHTNAEEEARKLLATLAPDVPTTPLVVNVTTAIGAHVGPNGLGFVALFQDETHQS